MESLLFVFAHPDDIAYGMGGLALLLKDKFDFHLVCATKGERGLPGRSLTETSAIREKEERQECELLGANLNFLGRIDAEVYADAETCQQVAEIVRRTAPVALFTLWPVDDHPDHSAVSEIARKAVSMAQRPIELIYFEAGDDQTALFTPAIYADISAVIDKKLELVRCHECQNQDDWLAQACLRKASRRGAEAGCAYAEGYQSLPHPSSDGRSIFSAMDQTRILVRGT
jgi:LmbE family N-acetylglucosaminyl deacetylase